MERLSKLLSQILRDNKHSKRWRVFATTMAAVVVFVTTYALILPAITMDYDTGSEMAGIDLLIDDQTYDRSGSTDVAAVGNGMLSDEMPVIDDTLVVDDQTGNQTRYADTSDQGISVDEAAVDDLLIDDASWTADDPVQSAGKNDQTVTIDTLTEEVSDEAADHSKSREVSVDDHAGENTGADSALISDTLDLDAKSDAAKAEDQEEKAEKAERSDRLEEENVADTLIVDAGRSGQTSGLQEVRLKTDVVDNVAVKATVEVAFSMIPDPERAVYLTVKEIEKGTNLYQNYTHAMYALYAAEHSSLSDSENQLYPADLSGKALSYYEIHLLDQTGAEVYPEDDIRVSMAFTDPGAEKAIDLAIYHFEGYQENQLINENGYEDTNEGIHLLPVMLEPLQKEYDENGNISKCSFETDTLSVFALAAETAAESSARQTGDETTGNMISNTLESSFGTEPFIDVPEEQIEAVFEEETEDETEEGLETVLKEEAETDETSEEILEEETEESLESVLEEETEEAVEGISEEETEEALEDVFEEETEDETEEPLEDVFEEETEEESETETEVLPAQTFDAATDYVHVYVEADEGAFPAGTTMTVTDIDDDETISAIEESVEQQVSKIHAVDITFRNAEGKEIEPLIPIHVTMKAEQSEQKEEVVVVHVDDEGNAETVDDADVTEKRGELQAELTEQGSQVPQEEAVADDHSIEENNDNTEDDGTEQIIVSSTEEDRDERDAAESYKVSSDNIADPVAAETSETEVEFSTDEFSVYALVYTVDFHYEVNGKMYEFSIPGGGFVSLEHLVELLGVTRMEEDSGSESDNDVNNDNTTSENGIFIEEEPGLGKNDSSESSYEESIILNNVEVSEATKEFVADVASVEFSSPELVWVGKVNETATVGELKEANELEVQYSAELTKEQIKEINSSTVGAGDWALISILPFMSEEALTVTMKNGDVWTIIVTDDQDSLGLDSKTFIISHNGYAMLADPEENQWRKQLNSGDVFNEKAPWTIEYSSSVGGYYLKSYDNKYLKLNPSYNPLTLRDVTLVASKNEATVLKIERNGSNGTYRISGKNQIAYNDFILQYHENDQYQPYFAGQYAANNGESWLTLTEYTPPTVYDNVGDWLLYFDDDFSEITIHVGETITLRPYKKWEWKEGNVDIQTAHWNVGGSTWSDWSISSSDGNGSKLSNATDGPFEFTRYVKYDDQLVTHYWSVQGRATQTGTYTLTNTKNDKTITVHVVDGAPVNKPNTINKIANIKVNLFDYDRDKVLDPANDTNRANTHFNNSINYNNKALWFLSSGGGNTSGHYGSNWSNDQFDLNDYTQDRAHTGLVQNSLNSDGFPSLTYRYDNSQSSLKYLFDTSAASQVWHGGDNNNGMIAYPGVVGMFQKDSNGYYYFNSNTNYYYYDTATGRSKLYEHTYTQTSSADKGSLVNDKPIGFFPFHDYDSTKDLYVNQNSNLNHHVGMSMEVEFMLSNNRLDDYDQPIIFDFSGDDDLWVFVEWIDDYGKKQSQLLLDLGGVHQPIHGQINFTNGSNTTFIQTNRPYTLKVFYLERGGCDSNCSIRFNLPVIQDLTVAKKLTGLTEAEKIKYKDEEFTYEIVVNNQPYNYPNPNNRYEKAVLRDAAGEDITPENYTITNGRVTIKDGQTLTISYLDRSDKFSVAEVNTSNMDNFEVPNAERYYHLPHDASLYEQEIALTASQTKAEPHTDDWVTPTYELEDTERVTFTNTLKEKNLEVEKKWIGEQEHPDSITFTVSATVDDGNGGRTSYAVSELKEADGTTDKVFTLSDNNHWRYEIEHLPVNTPDGKFIFYDIEEGYVEGYALTGVTDLTAESYNYCNVDVVKLWPDSNGEHTEVIETVLKNVSTGKYYAGVGTDGEAIFTDNISGAQVFELNSDNNYTHRFARVPAGTYTAEQINEVAYTEGLATYIRNIIQYELENSPVNEPVGPTDKPNEPEIHKRIDSLRDDVVNSDSPHTGEDLTDLYRLYLDYKVKSLQEESGVDLLFVIDHSGSMNNTEWQGNPYRAPAVEAALNGADGLISEFLDMNEKNQWAAVGFKGPDGARNYYWSLSNPWQPATETSLYNAGINGSEVLSSGGTSYVFTRTNNTSGKNVALNNEGANILTNYTAGFWRAEQFLLKPSVKEDGRKKVIVFISDGIPTLHINCPNGTLQDAGTANGSPYYRDAYGGCPDQTLTEFGYFVNDMNQYGYTFGDNVELYTIGFGGTMQTAIGSKLLNDMLDIVYGQTDHSDHFMTISDTYYNPLVSVIDYSEATENLKNNLRTIMGMNEKFSNIVIQDDLSAYVDLYGIAEAGTGATSIMQAARAKVTMSIQDPNMPGGTQTVTLYENGASSTSESAKFSKTNGTKATIIQELRYDAATKTVKVIFDPEYTAVAGAVYTLSFDVRATDTAYTTYAESGYDRYTSGKNQGQIILGDPDTDFLGTTPANATSVNKEGFRSNDEANVTYNHNGNDEELEYSHPVIQVAAKVDILKVDQTGAALEGAKFNLYSDSYDASKTIEENAGCLIEADLQSKRPAGQAGEGAVIRSGKLTVGTYYLVETQTPGGYLLLSDPVKITITETEGNLNLSAEIAGISVGNKLERIGKGSWKLSVQNSAGYELPSTGGNGTLLIYLFGIMLTGIAGIGLDMRKRRRAV